MPRGIFLIEVIVSTFVCKNDLVINFIKVAVLGWFLDINVIKPCFLIDFALTLFLAKLSLNVLKLDYIFCRLIVSVLHNRGESL